MIEQNVTDVTAQQEWETEWNQAGLASRLSEQVTSQTLHHSDTAPSVIEQNVTDVTAQQEWETEWNQAGLASRLSEQVTRPLDKSA